MFFTGVGGVALGRSEDQKDFEKPPTLGVEEAVGLFSCVGCCVEVDGGAMTADGGGQVVVRVGRSTACSADISCLRR